jgi:hypothetical protein
MQSRILGTTMPVIEFALDPTSPLFLKPVNFLG